MSSRLRLSATHFLPFMDLSDHAKNICKGITCNLIKYLSKSANITYDLVVYQKTHSVQLKNGSWDSFVGLIAQGQADLTATQVVMAEKPFTQNILDYTQPIFYDDPIVLTRYLDSYTSADFNNIKIFDRTSWILFINLIIQLTIILAILDKFITKDNRKMIKRISYAIFVITSTLLCQDNQIKRVLYQRISTMFLMTAWLFSSLQLTQIISGEITAMFSLKIPNKQINTLAELLDSKLKLVSFVGFMNMQNVQDKSVFNRINQKIMQDKSLVTILEMFQNSQYIVDTSLGKTAMLFGALPLKMIIKKHLNVIDPGTKFHFLHENYRNAMMLSLGMSMRLSKEFRNLINLKVLHYISTGIFDHQLKFVLSKSERLFVVQENIEQIYEQITLDNVFSLFKMTNILLLVCLVILVLEFSSIRLLQ